MNKWDLMLATKHEIYAKYPASRRFFDSGFELDPRNHADNRLGLISLQQVITLDLITGDFKPVQPKEIEYAAA